MKTVFLGRARIRTNPTITPEAHELYLYAISDGDLYRQQGEPIIKNLARKMAKGTFNASLAVKLYTYLADNAAKKYTFEHDDKGSARVWQQVKGFGIFTISARREAATHLLDHYMEQIDATARVMLAKTKLYRTGDGKRFHTEQAARDHANAVFKRTGNIIAVDALARVLNAKQVRKNPLPGRWKHQDYPLEMWMLGESADKRYPAVWITRDKLSDVYVVDTHDKRIGKYRKLAEAKRVAREQVA